MEQGGQVATEPMAFGEAGHANDKAQHHDKKLDQTNGEKYPAFSPARSDTIRHEAPQNPPIERNDEDL